MASAFDPNLTFRDKYNRIQYIQPNTHPFIEKRGAKEGSSKKAWKLKSIKVYILEETKIVAIF